MYMVLVELYCYIFGSQVPSETQICKSSRRRDFALSLYSFCLCVRTESQWGDHISRFSCMWRAATISCPVTEVSPFASVTPDHCHTYRYGTGQTCDNWLFSQVIEDLQFMSTYMYLREGPGTSTLCFTPPVHWTFELNSWLYSRERTVRTDVNSSRPAITLILLEYPQLNILSFKVD